MTAMASTFPSTSLGIQPPRIHPGDIINDDDILANIGIEHNINTAYLPWLQTIDIILLLGGGVPLSPLEPPIYVQRRCDAVAQIMHNIDKCLRSLSDEIVDSKVRGEGDEGKGNVSVICLSAGTAHLPQFILPQTGLPLWESTASAAYLLQHSTYPVPSSKVFVETTSYDTISNAFFARTIMTDIMSQDDNNRRNPRPRRVLVVTNEFHVGRSKAIFDWIFGVPSSSSSSSSSSSTLEHQRYEMFYLSCNNIGLTTEAINARKAHELRGENNVRTKLSVQYRTLHDVWKFLTTEHDFYSASKLVERAMATSSSTTCRDGENTLHSSTAEEGVLKLSYGKTYVSSSSLPSPPTSLVQVKHGKGVLTLDALSILIIAIASLLYLYIYQK